jgi:hypothetical protein
VRRGRHRDHAAGVVGRLRLDHGQPLAVLPARTGSRKWTFTWAAALNAPSGTTISATAWPIAVSSSAMTTPPWSTP